MPGASPAGASTAGASAPGASAVGASAAGEPQQIVSDRLLGTLEESLLAILDLLDDHRPRTWDAGERLMVDRTRAFVVAHPDCLRRTCLTGHLTASAWIVDPARSRALLTHHAILDRWFQLGGHADGQADLAAAALREATEESGLTRLHLVSPALFDLDRHWIPARRLEPGHWHHDFRFLVEADPNEPLVVSSESKDLAWLGLDEILQRNSSASITRMVERTRGR